MESNLLVKLAKLWAPENGSHRSAHCAPQRRPFAGKFLEFVHKLCDFATRAFIGKVLRDQPSFVGLSAAFGNFFFV
jgi:hypothetical protein